MILFTRYTGAFGGRGKAADFTVTRQCQPSSVTITIFVFKDNLLLIINLSQSIAVYAKKYNLCRYYRTQMTFPVNKIYNKKI